jgi:hypothetical protein
MSATAIIVPITAFENAESRDLSIPPCVQKAIDDLSGKVSSPEYVKTPQFVRRGGRPRGHRSGGSVEMEWSGAGESASRFKATVLQKRDGMEGVIDRLRKHLNKMSERTYDSLREKAFAEIRSHEGAHNSLDVSNAVFNIVSSNGFYSELYSKFYANLLDEFPAMKATLDTNIQEAKTYMSDVVTKDPNEDYDAFCDQNKLNAAKRARGKFYVHLVARNVIGVEVIISVIQAVQSALLGAEEDRQAMGIRDELSETLFEMLAAGKSAGLCQHSGWNAVKRDLAKYASLKPDANKGITGKSIFRHMDILDAIATWS